MKQRINLYIDGDLWRQFRAACIQRGYSASKIAEVLINEQMAAWAFMVETEAKQSSHMHTEVDHVDTHSD